MLEKLKREVCAANLALYQANLITLTFGNVSGLARGQGLVVIKPSGVPYQKLTPARLVVVDLAGKVVEGRYKPSMDTAAHLELYKAWPELGGVAHTHSSYATMFAQARRALPCLGTTHADFFYGEVPVTRPLTPKEVKDDYERNTGKVIVARFAKLDPLKMPAALVASHGPFTWGRDPAEAVETSLALEEVAKTALGTRQLNPQLDPLTGPLLDKHFFRKHGPQAYYGQRRRK